MGRSARHRLERDRAREEDVRQLGHQRHDLVAPQLGHRRLQDGPVHALHELPRGHPRVRQPGQLGGVALGRHAHLRLLLAPRHARTVRQPARRDEELRVRGLLVERPRHHARDVLRSGVGHLAHVAQGEGHPGGLHRPLPQLHERDLRPGQVDRAAHGHGHGAGDGDRLRVDHRGHLRQGVRRRPHHRLRRVQALRARRDGRRAQDARVGGRGVAASRRASSARWRTSGRASARSSRPARAAARAAPAAPPTAPSGRG